MGKRRKGAFGEKTSSEKKKETEKITHTKFLKTERELEAISLYFNTYGILLDHKCLSIKPFVQENKVSRMEG